MKTIDANVFEALHGKGRKSNLDYETFLKENDFFLLEEGEDYTNKSSTDQGVRNAAKTLGYTVSIKSVKDLTVGDGDSAAVIANGLAVSVTKG